MRRFDKKKHIQKANLLAEQRYLEAKDLLKEIFPTKDAFDKIASSLDTYDTLQLSPPPKDKNKPTTEAPNMAWEMERQDRPQHDRPQKVAEESDPMTTLNGLAKYFSGNETKSLSNDAAGYQFVKRKDGVMLQFFKKDGIGEYKFYNTFKGFIKAVLWRIKRG